MQKKTFGIRDRKKNYEAKLIRVRKFVLKALVEVFWMHLLGHWSFATLGLNDAENRDLSGWLEATAMGSYLGHLQGGGDDRV